MAPGGMAGCSGDQNVRVVEAGATTRKIAMAAA
jgi:hypothetical protein